MVGVADRRIVVAVTGASGGPYAVRLVQGLADAGVQVELIISPHGEGLLRQECGITRFDDVGLLGRSVPNLTRHEYTNLSSPLSSGSFLTEGMVICPCTSHTLGGIAAGLGDNLITRAAHVTLKEGRRLVIVHREMPASAIDLENLLCLARAGALVCPASPGFYHRPTQIAELVDFVAGRVLDLLGIEHNWLIRWADPEITGPGGGADEVEGTP